MIKRILGTIWFSLRLVLAFALFQICLLVLMWLLYLQYPTMQMKMKLDPSLRPTLLAKHKTSSLPGPFSPQLIMAYAGMPIALTPPFNRNYTLELDQVVHKEEALQRVKKLAAHGFKAYYLPTKVGSTNKFRIRSGFFKGKLLAILKGNMLRNKTNLTYAVIELP